MDKKKDSNFEIVEIISAYPLSEKEIEEIKKTVFSKKKVSIKNIVDKSIIGGIIIRQGSSIIDGSIVNYLNKFKKYL